MSGQDREAWLQQQVIDRDRFIELDQAEIRRRGLRIESLEAENDRLHRLVATLSRALERYQAEIDADTNAAVETGGER